MWIQGVPFQASSWSQLRLVAVVHLQRSKLFPSHYPLARIVLDALFSHSDLYVIYIWTLLIYQIYAYNTQKFMKQGFIMLAGETLFASVFVFFSFVTITTCTHLNVAFGIRRMVGIYWISGVLHLQLLCSMWSGWVVCCHVGISPSTISH